MQVMKLYILSLNIQFKFKNQIKMMNIINIVGIIILEMIIIYEFLCTAVQILYQIVYREFKHPFSVSDFRIKKRSDENVMNGIFINSICLIGFCCLFLFVLMPDIIWIQICTSLSLFIVLLTISLFDFMNSYYTAQKHIRKSIRENIINFICDILCFAASVLCLITGIGLLF